MVNALLASPRPYEIVALIRAPTSAAARALAANSTKITLLEGDLNDCPAIFAKAGAQGSIYGVFSVQLPVFGQKNVAEDIEQKQGFALIDAALVAGVKQIFYSSVDRGGSNSINDATNVPHFASKHSVD